MKKLFSSLLLLLAVFSLASSSSEVSAAVAPSGTSINAKMVASREILEVIGPSDELVQHMMDQIADVDPRFNNLSQYMSLTYFMTVDSYGRKDAQYNWQRDILGGYKFYIMPRVGWSSSTKSLSAQFAPVSGSTGWGSYSTYDHAFASGASAGVLNALFASDWSLSEGRDAYVYGFSFDADGTLNQPISNAANNTTSTLTAFNVYLYDPLDSYNVGLSSARAMVVRGNLINMPLYYRIPSLDADSLDGDGGSGGDEGGFLAGFWDNFVFLFTGILDSLWNDIVGFFSPIVDFFVGIWDWFVDLFKFLFVPSEEFLSEMMTHWNDWMRETFGALYEALDIGLDILGIMYKNVFQGDTIINLGTLFGGEAYIDYGVIERELPSLFALLQLILRFTTGWAVLRSAIYLLVAIASDRKIM